MKILLVLACFALAVAAGAAGALLVSTPAPTQPTLSAASSVARPITEPHPIAPAALEDADLSARVDSLSLEIAALQAELERMREGTGRAPVAAVARAAGAAPATAPDEFAQAHREGILQVIEEDRQAREQKREDEREQREMDALLARAERVAKELGLSAMQQKSLADVYTLENQQIADLRALARDGNFTDTRGQIREQLGTLREWRTTEFTARFGADLARRINESDTDRWRQGDRGRAGTALTGDSGTDSPR